MQTTLTTAPTCSPARRGFGDLPCPLCGAEEAMVLLDLRATTDEDSFKCDECSETFGMERIKAFLAKWAPVVKWLECCPTIE